MCHMVCKHLPTEEGNTYHRMQRKIRIQYARGNTQPGNRGVMPAFPLCSQRKKQTTTLRYRWLLSARVNRYAVKIGRFTRFTYMKCPRQGYAVCALNIV